MKRRPASLALRLTAFLGIATTLVFLVFGWIIERSIERQYAEQDIDELRTVAFAIKRSLSAPPSGRSISTLNDELAGAVAGHHGIFYYVADTAGKRLFSMPGPDLASIAGRVTSAPEIDSRSLYEWQENDKWYRGAVVRSGSGESYTIVVATTMEFFLHYLERFRRILWIATLVACVTVILAAWLIVYQGHAPLRSISKRIRGVTSEQLHVRLAPEEVPIELAELVVSFNEMLHRIEEGFRRLSNFSADIAHELRTPVTNLTTETQVALSAARSAEQYREILYSNLEEYERMAEMISDMLFLAQTDHGLLKPQSANEDLATQIGALFDYFEAWAEERNVSLLLEGDAPPVRVDRSMLRRALSNLLSNAIRYTPPGQSVRVRLSANADSVLIHVENPGAEILPEHLPKLFDRFFRIDSSRQRKGDGAGLGLAIVKSIVEAHGGSVSAHSGQGRTWFQIVLPRVS